MFEHGTVVYKSNNFDDIEYFAGVNFDPIQWKFNTKTTSGYPNPRGPNNATNIQILEKYHPCQP